MRCGTLNVDTDKLKIHLVNNNLSITQLPKITNLSAATIYRMFRTKQASIRTLGKISDALRIDVKEVVDNVHQV